MSHTPLPWHAPGMGEIHAENHDSVAQICFHTGDDEDSQCGTEDDAAFIVTACNAHYGLVEALEKIAGMDGEAAKIASLALINARLV